MLAISIILLSYCILVIVLIIGWLKSRAQYIPNAVGTENFISVIIAFRNEAAYLPRLLETLAAQTYRQFEVIFVDDHSSDQSLTVLKNSSLKNLKILTNPGIGKKSALAHGIYYAKGEIIITTDADCTLPVNWLTSVNLFFQDANLMMLFGAVRLQPSHTFFQRLQAIEFASLIGSSGAAAALGKPVMCNGANLAYRRSVFMEVNGYLGNEHIASGDDEFLMRKIFERYPFGIQFAHSQAATVDTQPQPDLRSFFTQRIRWASKWKSNSSIHTVALAFFILASQVASLWCIISLLTSVSIVPLCLLLIKALAESLFLGQVCRFLKIKWNWLAFIVLQFVYPIYVISVGIVSNFVAYSWKDRKIR